MTYRFSGTLSVKTIKGETIVLDRASRTAHLFNETGSLIFASLYEGKSVAETVSAVVDSFDVDQATALRDVNGFVAKLKALNLIGESCDG